MAGKGRGKSTYAGIEINFSANYTDLVNSMKDIDKEAKQLQKNLSETQKALAFDPDNIELAALNEKNLALAIDNVTEKLRLLKEAEKEVNAGFEAGNIQADAYARFQTEIAKTTTTLEQLKKQQSVQTENADALAEKVLHLKTRLNEYNEAAEKAAKSGSETEIFGIDKKIQETTDKIEQYKARISTLLNEENGLKEGQDRLKISTEELGKAQEEVSSSTQIMSDGFSVTKGVISDLASSVIKKTANALVDFTKGALEAASSLYEVENVVDVAFEDMRNKVDDFSATAIEYYGISELTAKRTASLFAAMGKGMDLTLDKATDMAIGLAKRSADMASFYDISQDITSTALKSVFTGETESLKRFGVVMTEVNLQQYALSQGIEKSIKDMTQAEKVQLRYNYLMQQTASAEGDFARTADSFANKTRQLKERLTETSVAIGERFIKNLDGAFTTLDEMLEKVNKAAESGELDDFIEDISDILKDLLKVLSAVGGVLVKFPKLTATAAAGFTALKTVSEINKPFEQAAEGVGKLAFNMSSATDQTGLLSSKLTMSAGSWAMAATAAISAAMALADYLDKLGEAKLNQQFLTDEQKKAVDAAKELTETYKQNAESRRENLESIQAQYAGYAQQAKRLTELASKTEKTNADLEEMNSIAERLNSSMEGFGLEVDSTTGSINMQDEELQKLISSYENLAKAEAAKNVLSEAYEEQYKAIAKVNAISEKKVEINKKLNEAEIRYHEALRNSKVAFEHSEKYTVEEIEKLREEEQTSLDTVNGLKNAISSLCEEFVEYAEQLHLSEEQVAQLNKLYEEATQGSAEAAQKLAEQTEELKKQAKAAEELEKAYSNAESSISTYKSQISDLTKLQTELSSGTEMSTLEMLDMIEKYPELIGQIKETENGYTLEKKAIEALIEARLKDMQIAARQAAENKRAILEQSGVSSSIISIFEQGFDSGKIKDIAALQAGQYTDDIKEYITVYSKKAGIDKLTQQILADGFKEGAKVTEEAEKKTSTKSGKATIAQAEMLVTALEHKFKQGKISAETYYNDLDKIAQEYYGNQYGYLERFEELEDQAQAGIKKAIEDKAKSYQDLESKIESVIDAEKELRGIESNRNVLAYDEARGFTLESDQSALASASKTLADAQRQLMLSLADLSGDSGIYSALSDKLADSTSRALREILPDLTDAYSEAAAYEEAIPTNQSYTFNFGDIKTSGDAQEFLKMLNDFVNAVINQTQID